MLFEHCQSRQPMLNLEQLHRHFQPIDLGDLVFELNAQIGDFLLPRRQVIVRLLEFTLQVIQRGLLFLKLLLRLVVQIVCFVSAITRAADEQEQKQVPHSRVDVRDRVVDTPHRTSLPLELDDTSAANCGRSARSVARPPMERIPRPEACDNLPAQISAAAATSRSGTSFAAAGWVELAAIANRDNAKTDSRRCTILCRTRSLPRNSEPFDRQR